MWFLRARPPRAALPAALLALLALPALGARRGDRHRDDSHAGKQGSRKSLRPLKEEEDDGLVRPFRFDQRLLVCNAYPSASPMDVRQDGKVLAGGHDAIPFSECRYLTTRVKPHDKLDLTLQGQELHGTFEVGELPSTDAVLLLVPERRPGSAVVSFQSFAFPTSTNGKDAQLAVIDTFKSNGTAPHLQVEDHMTGKEEQTVSKRIEQLNFDRVYSVEAGVYDASVGQGVSSRRGALKMLNLQQDQNYVVLRTGDDEGNFPESLVVFPDTPLPPPPPKKSSAPRLLIGGLAAALPVAGDP